MAISWVTSSTGKASAASGNLSVTPGTTQTDDIMVLAVSTHDNVAISLPAGWAIIQQGNNGTGLRATTAWKRAVGAEGAFTITHTAGDTISAVVTAFRGCDPRAGSTVINASVLTPNASSSTCTAATITSTVDGCWLVFTMHDSDNGSSSVQSSANLGSMTEDGDESSTLGLDAAVSIAHVAQVSAGASGSSTGTFSLGPDVNSGGNIFLRVNPYKDAADGSGTGSAGGSGVGAATSAVVAGSAGVTGGTTNGISIFIGVGQSTGEASSSVTSALVFGGDGNAEGVATGSAVPTVVVLGDGASSGIATAQADGEDAGAGGTIVEADGVSAGASTAEWISEYKFAALFWGGNSQWHGNTSPHTKKEEAKSEPQEAVSEALAPLEPPKPRKIHPTGHLGPLALSKPQPSAALPLVVFDPVEAVLVPAARLEPERLEAELLEAERIAFEELDYFTRAAYLLLLAA